MRICEPAVRHCAPGRRLIKLTHVPKIAIDVLAPGAAAASCRAHLLPEDVALALGQCLAVAVVARSLGGTVAAQVEVVAEFTDTDEAGLKASFSLGRVLADRLDVVSGRA